MSRRKREGALLQSLSVRRAAHSLERTAITPLPALIHKDGFELSLVLRNGRVAICRQHLPGSDPDHDAYEVILPQVRTTNHKGEPVEPYEAYPSAESWGNKAWTFTNLAKAVQRLIQLTRKASRAGTVSRRNRRDGQGSLRRDGQGSFPVRLKARTLPLVPRQMFQTRVEPEVEISFTGMQCTPRQGSSQNEHSRNER